jgi:hypothetical protein
MFGFLGLAFNRMWTAAGKVPTLDPPPEVTYVPTYYILGF